MSTRSYEANFAPLPDPRSVRPPSPIDKKFSMRDRVRAPFLVGTTVLGGVGALVLFEVAQQIDTRPGVIDPTTPDGQSPASTAGSPEDQDYLAGFEKLKVEYPGRFRVQESANEVFALAGDNTLEIRREYKTAEVAHASTLRIQKGILPKDAIVTEDDTATPDVTLVKRGKQDYFEFTVLPSGDPYLSFVPTTPDGVKRDAKQKALSLTVPFEYAPRSQDGRVSPVVIKAQSPISNTEVIKEDHAIAVGYRQNGVNVSEVIFADGMGVESYVLNPDTDAETYGIVVPYDAMFDPAFRRDKVETAMRNATLLYNTALQKAPDEVGAFQDRFTALSEMAANVYGGQQAALEQMIADRQSFSGLKGSPFFQAFDLYDPATNKQRYPKNADFNTARGFFETVSATLAVNFGPFSEYVKTLPAKDRDPIRDVVNDYLNLLNVTAGYTRRNFPLVVQNYNALMSLFNG